MRPSYKAASSSWNGSQTSMEKSHNSTLLKHSPTGSLEASNSQEIPKMHVNEKIVTIV